MEIYLQVVYFALLLYENRDDVELTWWFLQCRNKRRDWYEWIMKEQHNKVSS